MWHRRRRRRLGVVTEHRRALLRNLVIGLVEHSRIRTTYPRAKEASRFAEKLVTVAKGGDLHARRLLISKLNSRPMAKKLLEEIAPLFRDQAGGYTRVLRYDRRPGDGAEMAILEFTRVIEKLAEPAGKKKEKKKKAPKEAPESEKAGEKPKKAEKPLKKQKLPEKAEKLEPPKKETKSPQPSRAETKPPSAETEKKKGVTPPQEEPKKGGFLSGLRRFLTGE